MRERFGIAVGALASTFIVPIGGWLMLPVSFVVATALHLVVVERLMVVPKDFSMAAIGVPGDISLRFEGIPMTRDGLDTTRICFGLRR